MIKLDQKPKFGHLRQIKFDVKRVTQITTGDDKKKTPPARDGSRIFSRGGADFQQKKSKILTTFFFRLTKLIFRALSKHCFAPILAKFSAPQAKFRKKQSIKKAVLGTF